MKEIKQFGERPDVDFKDRKSVYAILIKDGRILVVDVFGNIHLPGGGIDEGEDMEAALERECLEELGAEITNLVFVAQANHYYSKSKYGPINKLGSFYLAELAKMDRKLASEETHRPTWLTIEQFMSSTAGDFQKWAVQQALQQPPT